MAADKRQIEQGHTPNNTNTLPNAAHVGRVAPVPPLPPARITTVQARRVAIELRTSAITALILILLLAPAVVLLVAGVWSVGALALTLWGMWQTLHTSQASAALNDIATLDVAGRVAATGVSYYALLFSLIVLFVGLLGRGWQRLFLMPGLLFTLPSALALGFSADICFTMLTTRTGIPEVARIPLIGYVILDAILLAALLTDLRPTAQVRRQRLLRRLKRRQHPDADSNVSESSTLASLPAVHFGPSGPLGPLRVGDQNTLLLEGEAQPSSMDMSQAETAPVAVAPGHMLAGNDGSDDDTLILPSLPPKE